MTEDLIREILAMDDDIVIETFDDVIDRLETAKAAKEEDLQSDDDAEDVEDDDDEDENENEDDGGPKA